MMKKIFILVMILSAFAAALQAQTDTIVPGDNLVLEGVPQIPASMADEVGRYTEVRSAYFMSWHPVQREMIIGTRFAETLQVHKVEFPGGARTQLTFYKDRINGASFQPTRGNYLVLTKDIGGNEFFQKYRFDLASGAAVLVTDGKSRNTGGAWSNQGDRLAYGSTRRNGQDVDLWVVNPEDPQTDRLVAELQGGGWAILDWSPDDRRMLAIEYISVSQSKVWLIDAQDGAKNLVAPRDGKEKVSYGSAEFDRDGKGIFVTTDLGSEFLRLAHVDLTSGKHTFLTTAIPWDVDEFDLSEDGKTIAFVTNEDGLGVLRLIDAATGKDKPAPKLPAGIPGGFGWHKNNQDLAFTMSTAQSSNDVYSYNVKTGKLDRWTFSEAGGLNTSVFSLPELVQWKSFDGRMISGFLYRPPAKFTGKRPVIIDIHGGPEGQVRPDFVGTDNFYINELGIAIIYPNVRGSTGFGKTFATLDNGFLREDSYKDIEALLDWIAGRPDLDKDRIMVTGGSYGGHMVLAVATYYPERIRCAVDYVGISSLVTFLENTSPYRQDLRRVEYGDERDPKMREFLNRIAPMTNAGKIVRPLFVVQGGNDPRVPRSEAEQITATVRKNGTPVWYLMANDEGHGFAKKKNRDFLLYANVLFVKEFLLK